MRDIEVNSDRVTSVFVVLSTVVSLVGFFYSVTQLVRGNLHTVRRLSHWSDYVWVPLSVWIAVAFIQYVRKERKNKLRHRMLILVFSIILIGTAIDVAATLRPALSTDIALQWNDLLLNALLWTSLLIALVDWYRAKVKLVSRTSAPPHVPASPNQNL